MKPLFESPPPAAPPDEAKGPIVPTWLLFVFGGLAGLSAGLPFGLGTSMRSALTGVILVVIAMFLGHRTDRSLTAGIGLAAFFGVLLGMGAGFVWRTQELNATHRDTSRDPLFASAGRITRATIGATSTQEEWDKSGPQSIKYCHRVSFSVSQSEGTLDITAQRCDLSQNLWKFLDGRALQGIDIVYLPADLAARQLAPGHHTLLDFDYRYDRELSKSAIEALRERCVDPKDDACNPPGSQ